MEKLKSILFRDWLGPEGYVQEIASLPSDQIPQTTDKNVIFPYNYRQNEFDMFKYSKSQADNKLSPDDIREFLEPIEQNIKDTFKGFRPFTIPDWFLYLCVTVGYEVVMIISIATLFERNVVRVAFITILTFLIIPISHVLCKFIGLDAIKRVKKQTLEHIQKITNQQKFESKGFQWRVPENFPTWIELSRTGFYRETSTKLSQHGYSQLSSQQYQVLKFGDDDGSSQPLLPNALPGGQVNYT